MKPLLKAMFFLLLAALVWWVGWELNFRIIDEHLAKNAPKQLVERPAYGTRQRPFAVHVDEPGVYLVWAVGDSVAVQRVNP